MHEQRVESLKTESIPQLLRQLSTETTTLVRQEIALAKVELNEKIKVITSGAVMFGVAAVFAVGAFGALTTVFIAALALAMPVWAAALIVTIVYGIVVAVTALRGKKQLSGASLVPEQTAQSVKEDVEWAKTRAQSSKK